MSENAIRCSGFVIIIVLLLYIGLCKVKQTKCEKQENAEESCKRPCKPMMAKDYIYMLIIFGILIVVMMSFILYRDSSALNYFSFASTLSSIILSVIAIIMTINSEQRSEAAKSQLEQAAQAMAKMNDELNEKLMTIGRYSSSITENVEEFDLKLEDILNSARNTEALLGNNINKNDFDPVPLYKKELNSVIYGTLEVRNDGRSEQEYGDTNK